MPQYFRTFVFTLIAGFAMKRNQITTRLLSSLAIAGLIVGPIRAQVPGGNFNDSRVSPAAYDDYLQGR